MMEHVKVVDRREEGKHTLIPPDAKFSAHTGGELDDLFPRPCTYTINY